MAVLSTPQTRRCLWLEVRSNCPRPQSIELGDQLQKILQQESLAEISSLSVWRDGREVPLADCFHIRWAEEGETSADLCWAGDCQIVHGIGRGWESGLLEIRGDAGDCVGEQMTGGQIVVQGNAGDGLGRGMIGGRITVSGHVGDQAGGPCPGTLKGMTGGEIFIAGTAGKNLGERMRRGTILVRKSAGKGIAREMLAGTIVLGEPPKEPVGSGMKRGTVLILNDTAAEKFCPGPLFDAAVDYEPTFVRVLLRYLAKTADYPEAESMLESTYRRYSGDMLQGGRGEIFVRLVTP